MSQSTMPHTASAQPPQPVVARVRATTSATVRAPARQHPTIAALRGVAPLDHIAFGSDWPFSRRLFEVPATEVPDWGADLVPRDGDPAPALAALSGGERLQVDRRTTEALISRLAR